MGLFSKTKTVDIFFVGSEGTDLDRGIYAFYFNVDNGEIIKKSFVKSLASPLAMNKNGRFMYLTYRNGTGRAQDGGIWQYACMEVQLGLAARVGYEGRTYIQTVLNKERDYAYAIDYYNGEVVTVPIKTSKIIRVSKTVKLDGHSIDPVKQTESHPTFMTFTPDNTKLVVTDLGGDEVIFFTEGEKGELIKDEELSFKLTPGSGPLKLVYSKNRKFAYILNSISSTIACYSVKHNKFTLVDEVMTYSKDEYDGVNTPMDMVITENGRFIFVINKGDDTIVAFERDKETGKLTRVDCMETDEGPKSLLLFRDKYLLVACKQGGSLESFEIKEDEKRAVLYETHYQFTIHAPVCMEKGTENLRVVK